MGLTGSFRYFSSRRATAIDAKSGERDSYFLILIVFEEYRVAGVLEYLLSIKYANPHESMCQGSIYFYLLGDNISTSMWYNLDLLQKISKGSPFEWAVANQPCRPPMPVNTYKNRRFE
jgi:hypothetical protein